MSRAATLRPVWQVPLQLDTPSQSSLSRSTLFKVVTSFHICCIHSPVQVMAEVGQQPLCVVCVFRSIGILLVAQNESVCYENYVIVV